MANAKWNGFPGLTAQELDDADLLPLSDMSQAEGQRDRTVSIGVLKEATVPVPAAGATGERPGGPPVGFVWFDTTLGQPVWWDGSAWTQGSGGGGFYDLQMGFVGEPDAGAADVMLMPRGVVILALDPGEVSVGTSPTGSAQVEIEVNGVPAGGITIGTNGEATWDVPVDIELAAGDVLAIIAPDPADTTLADVLIAFRGDAS